MVKSGFSQSIDRVRERDDPNDRATKLLIKRIGIEGKVARRLVSHLIAYDLSVSVYDGSETVVSKSKSISAIMAAMNSTDEDYIFAYRGDGTRAGWVHLVYGNDGFDVISDYTLPLKEILAPVNAYADSLDDR